MADDDHGPDQVGVLRRWVDAGGLLRVLSQGSGAVTVALLTCTAGEEADRLTSADPAVAEWLNGNEAVE
jgi:hypothetical protein